MSRRFALPMLMFALVAVAFAQSPPSDADKAKTKKALQELGEFVGPWNGNGEAKVAGKNVLWKETINWGWKFTKEGDSWIAFEVEGGKYFKKGELRYRLKDKKYVFTVTNKDDQSEEYVGVINKQRLVLERTDAKNADVHKLTMSTAAEGVRFLLAYELQTGGKGLAGTVFKMTANKAGESLAGGGKKNECIVTGGLGTIAVTHNGKTYYVCCSGCRDEFNESPQKYIDAAAKKK